VDTFSKLIIFLLKIKYGSKTTVVYAYLLRIYRYYEVKI